MNEIIINERVRKISDAMAQEGMPLDDELKYKLYQCLWGEKSIIEERKRIFERYNVKTIGGRKNAR